MLFSNRKNSTHPIAKAITEYAGTAKDNVKVEGVEEIPGHGLKGNIEGKEVLAGNLKLLKKFNINYPKELEHEVDTIVAVAMFTRNEKCLVNYWFTRH